MRALQVEDPERIGGYVLLGRLGRGAMGTVYLSRSPGGRLVAVKVVHPELADDPGFRARFRHEVETARAVGGFWTAAVVDADPAAPRPWLVTEYVPGPTLYEAVTAHGGLPEPALRRLVAGLAEALLAIHGAGLVHRDLKPSNVLLAGDGPRVIDFGIAKALEGAGLTATGLVFGTPGYLSPEQIKGREITPASDVFALGAVLVYAASGQGPYGTGDVAALVYRAVHTPPCLDGVPPGLRALAARCLNVSPGLRPTPADLLAEVGTPDTAEWLPEAVRCDVEERRTEVVYLPPDVRQPTRRYTAVAAPPLPAANGQPHGARPPAAPFPAALSPAAPSAAGQSPAGLSAAAPPAAGQSPAGLSAAALSAAGTPRGAGPRVAPPHGVPLLAPGTGSRAVFRTSRVSALVWGSLAGIGALTCAPISGAASAAGNGGAGFLFFVAFVLLAIPAAQRLWALARPQRWVEVSGGGIAVGQGTRSRQLAWSQVARVRVVEDKHRPWLVIWLSDPQASRGGLGGGYRGEHGGFRAFPVGHERRRPARQREVRELRAALGWYGRDAYDPSP